MKWSRTFSLGKICMLVNETWAGDFAGKCNDALPEWNEKCKCCPRWFLQKYCFCGLPKRRESRRSGKSPAHHPPKYVIVDEGVPQEMTGRVGV
jgi:hypothetical protein